MITVRKSADRGYFDHGWLKTYHTFSFGDYFDPNHHEFNALRVINEDWVSPSIGFPKHPHKDMEILTYILSGSLKHQDSMGNSSVIEAGEFQRMTAGTGILHSEMNPSPDTTVHLLQIWIKPNEKNLEPSYEQRSYDPALYQNRFHLVASGRNDSKQVFIHQDVAVSVGKFDSLFEHTQTLDSERSYWLHLIEGKTEVNGTELNTGDAIAIEKESALALTAKAASHVILFDLKTLPKR